VIARRAWGPWLVRAALALGVLAALGLYLGSRFRIGIDAQVHQCLPPYRIWLIDRHDRRPARGATFAFVAGVSMQPYFAPGQIVIKRVAGIPGDRVTVTPARTTVNGVEVGVGLALAAQLARPVSAFVRETTVDAASVWMMGGTPDSFDSRYWGPLPGVQLRGRAYALH
jgi:conjugal transfer pilin signal peptidase TrbI